MDGLVLENNEIRIKSVELVDIINQFRELEEGKSKLQHKTLMEKNKKRSEYTEKIGNWRTAEFSAIVIY